MQCILSARCFLLLTPKIIYRPHQPRIATTGRAGAGAHIVIINAVIAKTSSAVGRRIELWMLAFLMSDS